MKSKELIEALIEDLTDETTLVDTDGDKLFIYGETYSAVMKDGRFIEFSGTKNTMEIRSALLELWDNDFSRIYSYILSKAPFTAKDARVIANSNTASLEELIDIIKDAASLGRMECAYDRTVTQETREELEKRGFQVVEGIDDKKPFLKIGW